MVNQLKINPATDGSNDSKSIERVQCIPADYLGNDITSSNPIPTTSLPLYTKNFDTTDGSVIYIGYAIPGTLDSDAGWQITKITISGAIIKFRYADSNLDFDNVWNNRGSLDYD
jgi:hypothetical protein